MVSDVKTVWGRQLDVWGEATEEDQVIIMSDIVQEVVVQTKNRVSLKLSPIPEVHGLKFVINYDMGARNANHTRLLPMA